MLAEWTREILSLSLQSAGMTSRGYIVKQNTKHMLLDQHEAQQYWPELKHGLKTVHLFHLHHSG